MGRLSFILFFIFYFAGSALISGQSIDGRSNIQLQERFKQISLNEGLSQSTVYSITQDKKGFIWVGTRAGGLNIYNGYEFKVYSSIATDTTTLSDNEITCVLEDSYETIWVGTRNGGLNRFDRNRETFTRYPYIDKEVNSTLSRSINVLYEDSQHTLWIGNRRELLKYDRENDEFIPVRSPPEYTIENVSGILEDSSGNLFLGTRERLIYYMPMEAKFISYDFNKTIASATGSDKKVPVSFNKDRNILVGSPEGLMLLKPGKDGFTRLSLSGNPPDALFNDVRTIFNEDDAFYWFGTYDGLIRYDVNHNEYQTFIHNGNNPLSLSHNSVYSFFRDNTGNIWIGTWNGGISFLAKNQQRFEHFRHEINNPFSLSNNVVSAFVEDKEGIWIGTETGGLNYLDTHTGKIGVFKNWNISNEANSNNVKTVFVDKNRDLWVGTFGDGLKKYNKSNSVFNSFLPRKRVFSISQDTSMNIWVGCQDGLYLVSDKGDLLKRYRYSLDDPTSLSDNHIMSILVDSRERIWLGTKGGGVNLYIPEKDNFFRVPVDSLSHRFSTEYVNSLCEDSNGRIWAGTNSGLYLYNENQMVLIPAQTPALKVDVVNSVIDDQIGHLWISTNQGLIRWLTVKDEIRYYNVRDGLQSNEFNRGASFRSRNGKLFFGGINGFNAFFPEDIVDNQVIPPVYITDFRLFNKIVKPLTQGSPLDVNIGEEESITLKYDQSFFGFDFVALNYQMPEKNQYEYILEGYDKDWNFAGTSRRASYMNLQPDTYRFRVRASNNDQVWNKQGTSILITILPPYWKTTWAYLIYFILIVSLFILLRRLIINRIEQNNLLENERLEKKRLEEINNLKLRFFTDISHEFRTPLTLIAGPLDKLKSKEIDDPETIYLYRIMSRNVSRLLRLVNQLMDFRKVENEKLKLQVSKGKLDVFIGEIIDSFRELAISKNIVLSYDIKNTLPDLQWFDKGIIDKIVFNLLANAFKFTSTDGQIEIILKGDPNLTEICVKDSGIGISVENIQKIFDRFFVVEDLSASSNTGTGIGLALTKKLVDLHRGKISVESKPGEGSCFTFSFCPYYGAYADEEIIQEDISTIGNISQHELFNEPEISNIQNSSKDQKQIMLVVEDNDDLRNFLKVSFKSFQILEASNGKDGLDIALRKLPDIIISDVMMPELNGLDLCQEIKSNFITSHIPIILLTAKTSVDNKILGMETGADAYVEKPFDLYFLDAQVKNLLLQRARLRNKYISFNPLFDDKDADANDPNQKFLLRVYEIVKDNVSDPELSVDSLGKLIGMSRAQLFRKFRTIMDKSPSDYIREVRLKLAYSLLTNKNYNINEIAYMSGFSSTSYFITCFKKYYGKTPGEIHENT